MGSKYILYVSSSYLLGLCGVAGLLMWVQWQKKQTQRFLSQWFKQKTYE